MASIKTRIRVLPIESYETNGARSKTKVHISAPDLDLGLKIYENRGV